MKEGRAKACIGEEDQKNVASAIQRTSWVVLPVVMAACIMQSLDRGTLAFAAADMNADLGFDAQTYGIASGLFFLTYGVVQVPSATLGLRLGIRWWYGFIIIGWGVAAAATSLVTNAAQLFALRLLLGAFESGALPCAWHVLSAFYPYDKLTKPYSSVILCTSISNAISAPIAAALLSMGGVAGLPGWRWLFLLEGVPTLLVGLTVWLLLAAEPLSAWWLTTQQREALHAAVHGQEAADSVCSRPSARQSWAMVVDAVRKPLLWVFMVVGLLWALTAFTLSSFLPLIVANMLNNTVLSSASASAGAHKNSAKAALLSTVPHFVAFLSTLLVAWHSDRVREKTAHVGLPYVVGAVVLACFGPVVRVSTVGGFVMLTAAMGCAFGGQSTMCARVAGLTPPAQAAITLALFNAICASLGGFAGPIAVGSILQALKSFEMAAVVLGVCMGVAGCIMLGVFVWERRRIRRSVGCSDSAAAACVAVEGAGNRGAVAQSV